MLALVALLLIVGYPAAATRAVRRGRRALLILAASTLLLICAAGVMLGVYHRVPSIPRLLLYALTLTLPAVLLPTLLLALRQHDANRGRTFGIALAGAMVGLLCGWLLAIYGLRGW
jgi:Kef-type K+ transport system membrane component KefB